MGRQRWWERFTGGPMTPEERAQYLTPRQRARYEADQARIAAAEDEARAAASAAAELTRAQQVLHHGSPEPTHDELMAEAEADPWGVVRRLAGRRAGEGLEVLAERAARDAARAPYRAPTVHPLAISRIATRGATQLDELLAFLASSGLAGRPDLVYGCSRVPDRISPGTTPHSEAARVVEWDVVHWPVELGAVPDGDGRGGPTLAVLDAGTRWVARRVGEPEVLDEELALRWCDEAGVGPEDCLGVARAVRIEQGPTDGPVHHLMTEVDGVVVLHRPTDRSAGATQRLADAAPVAIGPGALPAGSVAPASGVAGAVHTEVLTWSEIALVVQDRPQELPRVPSPAPHLPLTPHELLRAYLEVVGVAPWDCYGAQVTVHRRQRVVSRVGTAQGVAGPELPCADGRARRRWAAAQQVVVTYRDHPAYAEGRQRWAAYSAEVLQATLDRATTARDAVVHPNPGERFPDDGALLRAAVRWQDAVDRVLTFGAPHPAPHRYCWPPVDTHPPAPAAPEVAP